MDVVQGRLPPVHPIMHDLGKPEWHGDLAIEAWWDFSGREAALAKHLRAPSLMYRMHGCVSYMLCCCFLFLSPRWSRV